MEEYLIADIVSSIEPKFYLFIIWTKEFTMTHSWNKEYSLIVVFGIKTILSMRTRVVCQLPSTYAVSREFKPHISGERRVVSCFEADFDLHG